MENNKALHFNNPQLLAHIIHSQTMVHILSRGIGKSTGITSLWLLEELLKMPKCTGGLILPNAANQEKIMSQIYGMWTELGYREGEHYVIGKKPPKEWKEKGYNAPKKEFDNYVSWYNGSGFYILSAVTRHNGSNLDFLGVEEGRFCKLDAFMEVLYAVRGHEKYFGHLSYHKAILIVSDMPDPDYPEQDWILAYKNNMDTNSIIAIYNIQYQISELRKEGIEYIKEHIKTKKPQLLEKIALINHKIENYQQILNEFRLNTTFYQEADSLENIAVLGANTIMQWLVNSTDKDDFLRSVLNVRIKQTQNAYYASLNEKHHGYLSDDDLQHDELHIAFDYNNSFCPVVIGQPYGNEFRVINAMHVYNPMGLKDLIKKFCDYYHNHSVKRVVYYYDHTALQGRNALADISYNEVVINTFNELGWQVNDVYIGVASTHDSRIYIWNDSLKEMLPDTLKFRYNKAKCQTMIDAMLKTKIKHIVKDGSKRRTKDKSQETKKGIDQATATHYTEAMDMLWLGVRQTMSMQMLSLGNIS